MIFILSIFLGFISVVNKILLFLERKSGWISGMSIGLISGFYFWVIGLKILAVAEFGFFLVMLYGYARHSRQKLRVAIWINLTLSIISFSLCYFLFSGAFTLIETISSLSFIWGGHQLAVKRKPFGWLLILLAHATTATASFYVGQTTFAGLQVISGLVCFYALVNTFRAANKTRKLI